MRPNSRITPILIFTGIVLIALGFLWAALRWEFSLKNKIEIQKHEEGGHLWPVAKNNLEPVGLAHHPDCECNK